MMISVRADHGGGPAHMQLLTKYLLSNYEIHLAIPNEQPYWSRFQQLLGADRLVEIPHRQFTITSMWRLVREIARRDIDVIHSHGKGAGIYGRLSALLTKRKCVHTFHGVHIGEYGVINRALYLWLERILAFVTDRIIAVSTSEARQLKNLCIVPPEKLTVIENGIEIPEVTENKSNTGNRHHIVTVTRFDYAKNPELLCDIIDGLLSESAESPFVFDIVGDGEGRQTFENTISGYIDSGQVVMHGFLDNPFEIINNGWLYLSTSRWESFGLAVAEALVRSIPVIATEVTGSTDLIVDGRNGFLFPLDKPGEAVRLINVLSSDQTLYHSLSLNARSSSEVRFSAENMANETGKRYRQLLAD